MNRPKSGAASPNRVRPQPSPPSKKPRLLVRVTTRRTAQATSAVGASRIWVVARYKRLRQRALRTRLFLAAPQKFPALETSSLPTAHFVVKRTSGLLYSGREKLDLLTHSKERRRCRL